VTRSSEIASKAVGDAERTNATVQVLSTGAEKIGEVVKLIHSIARQTNLLALNATIEARVPVNPAGFAWLLEVKRWPTRPPRPPRRSPPRSRDAVLDQRRVRRSAASPRPSAR